ncbi:LysR family transcriptional regulator [Azospirillum doebereinerae]|uniref:LysR family transcriptional regulator n=1 Tax=Azospirillum doebereinerae TaxID=92933 RepID=UPI00163B78E3|nr:LysR family transcriptional regulator [Azospirillum doebereinerae]
MDSKQLMKFLAVVDHGSLGRAAQALNITQPALTRSVKELEAYLGVQLFLRQSTGMSLTKYGEMLERQARIVQTQLDHALDNIRALKSLEQTIVRVGVVSSASVVLLPDALSRMTSNYKNISFSVIEALEDDLTARLVNGDVDVAVAFRLPEGEDIERVATGFTHLGGTIVASSDHPFRGCPPVSLREVREKAWVLPPSGTRVRQEVADFFLANDLEPPVPRVETRSNLLMQTLVLHSNFITWFPQILLVSKEISIYPLVIKEDCKPQLRSFSIYRRKEKMLSSAATRLLYELKAELENR